MKLRTLALLGLSVFAVAACGDDDDPTPPPTTVAPSAPTNVAATVSGNTITVTWAASTTGTPAPTYTATLTAPGEAARTSSAGTSTTATFTDLTFGQTYTAQVTATNSAGSANSQAATVTIASNTSAPSAPGNVQATVSGTSITVTWDVSTGNPAPTYAVSLTTQGEADRNADAGTGTTATFDDLTPGATYTAQVTASNSEGTANSPAVSATIPATAGGAVIEVPNRILDDVTWTANNIYLLTEPTFVGIDCGPAGTTSGCNPATLTIEPGTTILGSTDLEPGVRGAYLVVTRGSKLIADATNGEDRRPTAEEVIVFTSDKARGQRNRNDWGGIIINGRAATNAGAEAEGEGDSGLYGGNLDTDDSGILRGVRIEFAGDDVTPADQLNGLALQGVGSGTTVSYVQIHYNEDDGIEPFGGTVSADHLVLTGIGDDSVDGTDGYRGFMQFIIAQHRAFRADNGMEISNDGEDGDFSPKSTAVVANATMIGASVVPAGAEIDDGGGSDRGVQFREASHYRVYNSIVTGFDDAGFCVENAQTVTNANNRLQAGWTPQNSLSFEGNILWSNKSEGGTDDNFEACGGYTEAENKAFFETAGFNNMLADPSIPDDAFRYGTQMAPPNFIPTAIPTGYQPAQVSAAPFDGVDLFAPADGRTLVQTTYAGAVEPGTALQNAWYYGWTVWTVDGSDSRPNGEGN